MSRGLRDLMMALAEAEQRARDAISAGDTPAAEAAMKEVRDLKARIAMQEELDGAAPTPSAGEARDRAELKTAYERVFAKALRGRRFTADDRDIVRSYEKEFGIRAAVMHEGGAEDQDDGDSSLVVPIDRQTRINELRRQLNDLTEFVRVETVSTLSGSRVLEKDEDMVPFAVVKEYGEIQTTDNPKFVPVTYALEKRAGILPLTNELLADNDANLLEYVTRWLARKVVVTYNSLVIAALNTLDKKPIADVADLKTALNVDLDPAIYLNSVVLTNQDGFNWLDNQVDGQDRPLLQPDPTQPTRRLLAGRPVAVVSNRHLPSTVDGDEVKYPIIMGDLRQLIVHFTRGQYELESTRVGGAAWRTDSTELRVITRDHMVTWDEAAAVYGEITISA